MKRTLIDKHSLDIPFPFLKYTQTSRIYDSSSSPEAKVYFIDGEEMLYLKRAAHGALDTESKMTEYFHSLGIGAEVLEYFSTDENDWLLTRAVSGEDCTHPDYLAEPKRLATLLGERLRELHSTDYSGCPIKDRMKTYEKTVEANRNKGLYDLSYLTDSLKHMNADSAYLYFKENKQRLKSDTLIHGDFCLPNVMLNKWNLSGFIDVGGGGVGDRHVDLYWGVWTLKFNLGTDKYREYFLSAYGKDMIDNSLINTVAAAEVFG